MARASELRTRTLEDADLDRAMTIRSRSFGILPAATSETYEADMREAIAAGRLVGVFDRDTLVARARLWDFQQWWGGRVVPMAGVAGVVVAPEYRGRGVGSAVMEASVERSRELGAVLSALYPATVPVYRQRGWEFAGSQYRYTYETRLLRDLRGSQVPVREAGADDARQVIELMRSLYSSGRASGPLDADEAELRADLQNPEVFGYLADGGFVMFGWEGADIAVSLFLAADVDAARSLWAVVGSGSSIAKHVHAYLAPDDPVVHLVSEGPQLAVQQNRWMLRLLDVRAALTGRGFPFGLSVDIPLVVEDGLVGPNCVAGRLQVAGGEATLVDGAPGPNAVRTGPNGLAALYAGTATWPLRIAGLLRGGDERAYADLDSAFAGRPAHLLEYF